MLSTTKNSNSATFQTGRKSGENYAKIAAFPMREALPERVRARLQRLVTERNFSHEALAPHVGVGASGVSKLLSGANAIGLGHLEGFCIALQITPSELLVEPDSIIQTVNPLELQLLRHFRQMTELQRASLLSVLDRSPQVPTSRRRPRLGRAELSEEQQLLVDLYARSNEQARTGILKTLRGTARQGDEDRGLTRPKTSG